MRLIEKQMNDAITASKNWQKDNTAVVEADGISVVLLHGNKIAEVGDNWIRLFDGNHQTVTTKSRLNAILKVHGIPGERVFQRNFEWRLSLPDGGDIPFFSGMRLN